VLPSSPLPVSPPPESPPPPESVPPPPPSLVVASDPPPSEPDDPDVLLEHATALHAAAAANETKRVTVRKEDLFMASILPRALSRASFLFWKGLCAGGKNSPLKRRVADAADVKGRCGVRRVGPAVGEVDVQMACRTPMLAARCVRKGALVDRRKAGVGSVLDPYRPKQERLELVHFGDAEAEGAAVHGGVRLRPQNWRHLALPDA
jgi:hypothetical protein